MKALARRLRCSVRCGRTSDMQCPHVESLEDLLAELDGSGWGRHFDDIDASAARSLLAYCTNCGGRGCFDYVGLRQGDEYRAFWTCARCGHWTEV